MVRDNNLASAHDLRAREIFAAAAEQPPAQRTAYIDTACADDPDLREHLLDLLRAHDRAGQFLAGATIIDADIPPRTDPPSEGPGSRIGPYKLLQLIGEGGFGTVYMAEQLHPVRRLVALKVIKLGMDTRQVIARFEAERQALAMMDHPNIARVLDAGSTTTGRPFFVMELVKGVPITQYCDENKLSARQRLELFLAVCRAVQHAHQKGIIHRDLKPSNVLVTVSDGQPLPKVIDFGIAKATRARLTDKTLFTELRQLVGTPEYMSPEQADPSSVDVDTRSDVYSLGVLLYELLTGTTPFDAKELRSKAFVEMQRIIREVDPPRPSTRLSTMGMHSTTIASRRRTEPRRLGQLLRTELDWVVMKCIEKDRKRRYETAHELAADVHRYLEGALVQARPPSRAYALRKLLRRHRGPIAAAGAVTLALLIGLAAATFGFFRARDERDKAVQSRLAEHQQRVAAEGARAAAESARVQAKEINNVLRELFASVNRRRTGDENAFHKALEDATERVESGAFGAQPEIEAAVRTTLGNVYLMWRYDAQAEQHLRKALEIRRRICPAAGHVDLADSLGDLGWLLHVRGDHAAAADLLREALDMRRRVLGRRHPVVAGTLNALAMVLFAQRLREDAYALVREAFDIRLEECDRALAASPEAADVWSNRAHVRARSGDIAGAVQDYTQAIQRNPRNHWNWYMRAALRLHLGDRAGYEEDCLEMWDRFSDVSVPQVAERAANVSLFTARPPVDPLLLAIPIDRALGADAPLYLKWFQIAKGMHEYRSGRYQSALQWLGRGRDGMTHASGRARADFFGAMALYRVGNKEQAVKVLERASRTVPEELLGLADRDPLDAGSAVHGWVINHLLRREAEALIKGPATSAMPPQSPAAEAELLVLPPQRDDALPRAGQGGDEP